MKYLALISILLVTACSEEAVVPDGFQYVASDGPAHFVLMDERFRGERKAQYTAGAKVCERYGDPEYCEVYMWTDPKKVAKKLPIKNRSTIIGRYTSKGGRTVIKAIKD